MSFIYNEAAYKDLPKGTVDWTFKNEGGPDVDVEARDIQGFVLRGLVCSGRTGQSNNTASRGDLLCRELFRAVSGEWEHQVPRKAFEKAPRLKL